METAQALRPSTLVHRVGITMGYASQLLSKKRKPSDEMAVRIWRETGAKLGRLENLSDSDAQAFADALALLKGVSRS